MTDTEIDAHLHDIRVEELGKILRNKEVDRLVLQRIVGKVIVALLGDVGHQEKQVGRALGAS